MLLTLKDHTKAKLEWTADGRCVIRFASLDRQFVTPANTPITGNFVNRLYAYAKRG